MGPVKLVLVSALGFFLQEKHVVRARTKLRSAKCLWHPLSGTN
jgi:hypothetical protein